MRRALLYALVAIPLGLTTLIAKLRLLELGGFVTVARGLGRADGTSLSGWERLTMFRMDLALAVVVLPLAFVALAAATRPRWQPAITTTLAIGLAILLYIQVRSLDTTGAFVDLRLLLSAVRFARERPEVGGTYVTLGGVLKLAAVIAASAALAWWAGRRAEGPLPRAMTITLRAALAALLVLTAAAWVPRLPSTPWHQALLPRALGGYWQHSAMPAEVPPATLVASYRELAQVAPSVADPARFARAAGYDVILWVLETAPARCLDLTGPLDDLPTIARLRQNALVGARHYTTYPYSSLANFSLLSGWYPPDHPRSYTRRQAGRRVPSLFWQLRGRGYRTALYEPFVARFENDPAMFRMLGVERHVEPGGHAAEKPGWATIVHQDSQALAMAQQDLERWLSADQRYAVMMLPQVGHGPWLDPVPGRTGLTLLQRCRALVLVQDGWIADLLAIIARHGRLDRTLFVLVGDHGVRTTQEDPDFVPGALDAGSFHVPLLIHARGALPNTTTIAGVTSMVDVAPTVLDLMGVTRDRSLEQGLPLWDAQVDTRTVFLFARVLLGADAFASRGRFVSWNSVSGAVCASLEALRCTPADILPRGPAADSATRLLQRITGLQRVWVEAFATDSTTP